MQTFTKNGQTRLAYSPSQAVNLRAQGWKEEEAPEAEAPAVEVEPEAPDETTETEPQPTE